MEIRLDDLTGLEVKRLLAEHVKHMHEITPPESIHALTIEELLKPDVTFWSAWDNEELLGCGALKELSPEHGEIKSMRTSETHRRKGVARKLLEHILAEAQGRGYVEISLETGAMPEFAAAKKLYEKFGFEHCGPFANYIEDPNSLFMTKKL